MGGILSFVLDTITSWTLDPNNAKYFFPNFMAQVDDGAYVPYDVPGTWTIGPSDELSGQIGLSICGPWSTVTPNFPSGNTGFPCGGTTIALSSVVVSGLNNLLVAAPEITFADDNTAQVTYSAEFNTYVSSIAQQFGLAGNFSLTQPCCAAATSSGPCNTTTPLSANVTGNGTFGAGMTTSPSPSVSLVLQLSFEEGPFQVLVSIPEGGLSITGGLDVTQVSIQNEGKYQWSTWAELAFSKAGTQAALMAQLVQQLNLSSNLQQVAGAIQSQFNGIVSSLAGTSEPASNVPSQQFFTDVIVSGMNYASSSIYLPDLISGSQSPVLEPLTIISGTDDLGNQTVRGFTFDVQLSSVVLAGLSNIQIPSSQVQVSDTGSVSFVAEFSLLQGLPPALSLTGSILLTDSDNNTLSGTFIVTINAATIQGVSTFSGQDASTFNIDVSSIELQPIASGNLTANVTLPGSEWAEGIVDNLIESTSMVTSIVGAINSGFASNLVAVNEQLTNAARAMISNGIGGVLPKAL